MPYASAKQRAYLHIHEPKLAARWDKELKGKKKYKIGVNNKMKGALGRMDPNTNRIEINVRKHKGDKAELASTIKHEIMHVKHPKMTEKEVYKRTAKTKIPEGEQKQLLSKLRNKKLNYKTGVLRRKFKMKSSEPVSPGTFISKMNEDKQPRITNINNLPKVEKISVMGLI